jgi:hypothetical protein
LPSQLAFLLRAYRRWRRDRSLYWFRR